MEGRQASATRPRVGRSSRGGDGRRTSCADPLGTFRAEPSPSIRSSWDSMAVHAVFDGVLAAACVYVCLMWSAMLAVSVQSGSSSLSSTNILLSRPPPLPRGGQGGSREAGRLAGRRPAGGGSLMWWVGPP